MRGSSLSSFRRTASPFPVSVRSLPSSTPSILTRIHPSSSSFFFTSSIPVSFFSSFPSSTVSFDSPSILSSSSSFAYPYTINRRIHSSSFSLSAPFIPSRFYRTTIPSFTSSSSTPSSASPSPPSSRGWFIGGIVLLAIGSGGIGLYLTIQNRKASEKAYARPLVPGCPLVYMNITDNDNSIGRIVIQLRKDIVPLTAENFRLLVTNGPGYGYRGSALFGVEKARRVFGGDFYSTGNGNYSAYGGLFGDENFTLKHDGPGVVGMRNNGPNTNGSQFYITFRALPELDGRTVVVGHVVEGWDILELLDKEAKSDNTFGKKHEYRISDCGEIKGHYTKIADTNMTKDEVDFINALTMIGKEFDKDEAEIRHKRFKDSVPDTKTISPGTAGSPRSP